MKTSKSHSEINWPLEVFLFLLETLFSEPIGTSLTEEVERFLRGNLHLKVSSGVDSDVLLKIGYNLKVSKSQRHFSWNSIAQKTNEILDKILPYKAG